MTKINFKPWVGKNYDKGINGKKVLVLGESHYCSPIEKRNCMGKICTQQNVSNCANFTIKVVGDYVNHYSGEKYEQTFLCFERAVANRELSQTEREEFWNSVMFYNYLQYAMDAPNQQPSATQWKMWAQSEEAFRELLETYEPDKIIVWGQRLFNALPEWDSTKDMLIATDGQQTPLRIYNFNSKKIPAMQVYHPSMPNGKARSWHVFYEAFLK